MSVKLGYLKLYFKNVMCKEIQINKKSPKLILKNKLLPNQPV